MSYPNTSILYEFDRNLCTKHSIAALVGTDEAGRGPLAGPVCAAAVVLDLKNEINGINDSKKITENNRYLLFERITNSALAWAVGSASVEEIEEVNILNASILAMQRAIDNITSTYGLVIVDGNKPLKTLDQKKQLTIIKGDTLSASIAAASIIAKCSRDNLMIQYHTLYPAYEFAQHKGYPTKKHIQALQSYGLCPIHRKSFCKHLLSTHISVHQNN